MPYHWCKTALRYNVQIPEERIFRHLFYFPPVHSVIFKSPPAIDHRTWNPNVSNAHKKFTAGWLLNQTYPTRPNFPGKVWKWNQLYVQCDHQEGRLSDLPRLSSLLYSKESPLRVSIFNLSCTQHWTQTPVSQQNWRKIRQSWWAKCIFPWQSNICRLGQIGTN